MAVITQIQFRRGTAAQWSSTNPVLSAGELGYETDTGNFKIGNGSTAWNALLVLNGITADSTATFTNKTISADNNTISGVAASSFVVSNSSGYIDGSAAQKAIPTGTVVGTSDSQTLTNKTISGADNTLSNIGNSSLTNSSVTVNGTAIALGASGTVTVPVSTGITGLGSGIATFLATPSSANLASAVTDETGSGALVFGTSPTLGGTVTASGIINMTATGAVGNVKDFQTLQIMDCI